MLAANYCDAIMGTVSSQITSLTIVYTAVYSDADQSKHQSSASLAFVWGIHWGPVNSPHKWPVTRKMFPFDDVIMRWLLTEWQRGQYIFKMVQWPVSGIISGRVNRNAEFLHISIEPEKNCTTKQNQAFHTEHIWLKMVQKLQIHVQKRKDFSSLVSGLLPRCDDITCDYNHI